MRYQCTLLPAAVANCFVFPTKSYAWSNFDSFSAAPLTLDLMEPTPSPSLSMLSIAFSTAPVTLPVISYFAFSCGNYSRRGGGGDGGDGDDDDDDDDGGGVSGECK